MKHNTTFQFDTEVLPDCCVGIVMMNKLGMSHFNESTGILEVYVARYGSNS